MRRKSFGVIRIAENRENRFLVGDFRANDLPRTLAHRRRARAADDSHRSVRGIMNDDAFVNDVDIKVAESQATAAVGKITRITMTLIALDREILLENEEFALSVGTPFSQLWQWCGRSSLPPQSR